MAIPEAEEVTIEIQRINWELLDDLYRYEWDDPEWLKRNKSESDEEFKERIKPVNDWNKRKLRLLESIARRIKYEALLKRVVAPGHIGKITSKAIYDVEPAAGVDPHYEVVTTKPARDVRVSENTRLVVKEKQAE
jgi:hypothetical protein